MSEPVSVSKAAALLRSSDNILILTHHYPDGDTLGSGFALCYALRALGKNAGVNCSDSIPDKYGFLYSNIGLAPDFEPDFICAVDTADVKLLGEKLSIYADDIDLCIDHHASNTRFADSLLLIPEYAATAMIIAEVIREMGVVIDLNMATGIYTGIATDTGCFKYSNTTSYTLRMAADMLDLGVNSEIINRAMFDVKSRARVELEKLALESIRFYLNDRCAIMRIMVDMIEKSGAGEDDLEGLAPLSRQIEGVYVGVTMREKTDGSFKVSVRTGNHANASAICAKLGGGGHVRAAGCTIDGPADRAVETVLEAVEAVIG
ncbi:MAG: bifunctional oligoribonuclease/PAP phosphatase NrnA [Oscillospiraceae bacterium]|nr:bifunctional oligoribonuclease/PAP phosphatase NrnA [Oscillospiraceae bacterium]MDD4413273.1 bifunctional oligoribonuclease/PAP phosphatase NrnA [Oscillospiraceae bacterium]